MHRPWPTISATLEARVRLRPGANRIEVRLSNEWGETALVVRQVTFQRPPRIVAIEEPVVSPKPFVDVVARVESPADLLPERVEINGRVWPAEAVHVEKIAGEEGQWRVVAAQVPLEAGDNVIRIAVANKDGPCREPSARKVHWAPPAPPARAEVEIVDPKVNENVAAPDYRVSFAVRSASPLARVQLLRGKQVLYTADLAAQKPDDAGLWRLKEIARVKLIPGPNDLHVEAVNDGGQQEAAVTLTCVYRPVRVTVERLESKTMPGQFFEPEKEPDARGRTVFRTVPEGKVRLHGAHRVGQRRRPAPGRHRPGSHLCQWFPADSGDPGSRDQGNDNAYIPGRHSL